jgi:hypothetical protein
MYAVLEHLRTAHHLLTWCMGGSLASRGGRCTRRVIFVYPTPAQLLVAAHPAATQRTGAVWALVVELSLQFDISRRARALHARSATNHYLLGYNPP